MTQIRFGGLARKSDLSAPRAPQPSVDLYWALAYSMVVTEIQIRATEPGDADALYDIFSGPRAVAGTLQMPWMPVEARRAWVQHDPNVHSLVATLEGRVVGQAGLHLQTRGRRRDC